MSISLSISGRDSLLENKLGWGTKFRMIVGVPGTRLKGAGILVQVSSRLPSSMLSAMEAKLSG